MADWKVVAKKLTVAAEKIRLEPDHDVVKSIKYGLINTGAGNGGCFNAWVFACGDVRHVGAYCYYILWFANHSESYTLAQLKDMTRLWPRQPAEFAAYCGFNELWGYIQEMCDCLDTITEKSQLVELVNALWEYANLVNAWIYQYIPWGAFKIAPTVTKEFYKESLDFLNK